MTNRHQYDFPPLFNVAIIDLSPVAGCCVPASRSATAEPAYFIELRVVRVSKIKSNNAYDRICKKICESLATSRLSFPETYITQHKCLLYYHTSKLSQLRTCFEGCGLAIRWWKHTADRGHHRSPDCHPLMQPETSTLELPLLTVLATHLSLQDAPKQRSDTKTWPSLKPTAVLRKMLLPASPWRQMAWVW